MIRKLIKEKKMLEITLESIGDAVIATDCDLNIVKMNRVAEELSGWSRQDAMGKSLDEIFHTIDAKTDLVIDNPFRQSLEKGLVMGLKKDTLLLSRDGRRSYVSASSSPIRDKQDKTMGLVVVFRDITRIRQVELNLKKAKEEAERANRAKDEFLAKMSHEIRTPLNGIIGMTTLMQLSELDPEQKENLDIIKMSGDLLLRVVNDILDFSKIEAGKMATEETDFNLGELILKNLGLHSTAAEAKGLVLKSDIDKDIPLLLRGDPYRIQQVLINLIGNAIKFTENGEITVEAVIQQRLDSAWLIKIAVSDTGIGISEEQMERLFRSFSQVDGSITRQYGGTGLGLYISKQLVNIMGGDMGVDSKPGQGSTFYFTIRCGTPSTRPPIITNEVMEINCRHKTTPDLNILLVEDNKANQLVIANLLTIRGHKVDIANNGKEALRVLEQKTFDIILMDIMMPEMDGIEATAQIRKQEEKTGKHVPIIAITAYAIRSDKERFLSAGMDDYIAKPVQMETLYHCVETAVLNSRGMAKQYDPLENPAAQAMLAQIGEDFMGNLEDELQELTTAFNTADLNNIERYAHRIKELAIKMDEIAIKNLAFKIELSARKGDIDQITVLLDSLRDKFNNLKLGA